MTHPQLIRSILAACLLVAVRADAQPTAIPCPPEADCAECACFREGNTVTWDDDSDGDGVANDRHILTFDDDGRLITQDVDFDADGTVDQRWVFTYNDRGELSTETYDIDVDGREGIIRTYSYDDQGNLLGTATQRLSYLFNEAGDRIGIAYDDDGDGDTDRECVFVHPCPPPYADCDQSCQDEGPTPTE